MTDIIGSASTPAKLKAHHHLVDFNLSWNQMVGVGENYFWVHDRITQERFPIVGQGVWEIQHKSFRFDDSFASKQVIEKMEEEGWKPGRNVDILACRARRSKTGFPIIALDAEGGEMVLSTKRNRDGFYLDMEPFSIDRVWPIRFHFLGIKMVRRIDKD